MNTTTIIPTKETGPPVSTICEVDDPQKKLAAAVNNVFAQKDALRIKALDNKWDRFNPFIIGGDAFTMATFAFQGIQTVAPQLSHLAAIATTNAACGIIAGVINMGVGATCFKQSMQAFHNGDRLLGLRLLIDSITITAIGAIMILISLSMQISALGAIGTFFQANAWVLPVLFFVISIPVILEITRRLKLIYNKEDLASKLDLKQIQKLLEQNKVSDACAHLLRKLELQDAKELKGEELIERLSTAMELLQANMGSEAALAVFQLLSHLQDANCEASLRALQKAQQEIRDWNHLQCVRLFQQFLYILAFGVSMSLLSPGISPSVATSISATQQFAMTGANAIPLVIDATMPFKRNPPIVIPKVETSSVN